MITDELENELRRTFARAGADSAIPGQARERLLQHDYHPRRGNRRLAASITAAAAAAAAVVLGLGLSGAIGSAPAHRTGTIQTAAFTLVSNANGTATLTLKPGELFDPGTLQRDLRQEGIPARVTVGSFCSSDPTPAGFSQAVSIPVQRGQGTTVTINPAAIPEGTELSFGTFQLADNRETAAALIDSGSYTCTSTAPTTLPTGGALLHWPKRRPAARSAPVLARARAAQCRPGPGLRLQTWLT